ncbi:MAG: hypothetical protein KJ804_06800 [Proteobacteria bacterium]|nr:hypothetical protein [Pseudomonadota bacterium]MBU1058009.1 hypothetical protein [Pseudomonadota bacterium]
MFFSVFLSKIAGRSDLAPMATILWKTGGNHEAVHRKVAEAVNLYHMNKFVGV